METILDSELGNADDFSQAMFASLDRFKEGEIIKGTIVKIDKNDVLVDIGYKSEGIVSKRDFRNQDDIDIGKEIDVYLESLEDSDGNLVLSKSRADKLRSWENAIRAFEEGDMVEGKILRKTKGGLIVDVGVDAFLPASQVDIRPHTDVNAHIGKIYNFKVVKINTSRKNVIVSRREFLEQERSRQREIILEKINKGDIITGAVKNITDFGAFIDLGGLDGLLHITDMSWGRINHPSDLFAVNDEVEVMVLDVNKEQARVSLGLKQKTENPWLSIEERYPMETQVKGTVVNMTGYGAFIELEQGVEGLIHVSEMSWTRRVKHPSEVLNVGDQVEAKVLNINIDQQKISLGLKQITDNPWDTMEEKYPIESKVKGIVRNITDYGAFLELEPGVDGLVHVTDISWTKKIGHPSSVLEKGQEMEAMVLSVNIETKKIALGLKQLTEDPWETVETRYEVGKEVKGSITKITKFGLFVELKEDGIEALVHNSNLSLPPDKTIDQCFNEGDEIAGFIDNLDKEQRKLGVILEK